MGAVATFLAIIIFLLGELCLPGSCAGLLPPEPPKRGRGGAGVGEVVLHTEQSWFCCSPAALWVLGLARDASLPGSHQEDEWGRGGRKTLAGVPVVHPVRYATGWEISEWGDVLLLMCST